MPHVRIHNQKRSRNSAGQTFRKEQRSDCVRGAVKENNGDVALTLSFAHFTYASSRVGVTVRWRRGSDGTNLWGLTIVDEGEEAGAKGADDRAALVSRTRCVDTALVECAKNWSSIQPTEGGRQLALCRTFGRWLPVIRPQRELKELVRWKWVAPTVPLVVLYLSIGKGPRSFVHHWDLKGRLPGAIHHPRRWKRSDERGRVHAVRVVHEDLLYNGRAQRVTYKVGCSHSNRIQQPNCVSRKILQGVGRRRMQRGKEKQALRECSKRAGRRDWIRKTAAAAGVSLIVPHYKEALSC